MLPYLQLQAMLCVASGLLALLCFGVAGLIFRVRFLLRYITALAAVCVGSVLWLIAGRVVFPYEVVNSFSVVALVFYAASLWLPLFSLVAGRRKQPEVRRTLGITRLFALISILVGIDALLIEPNRLVEREDRLEFSAWDSDTRPLRIAHISDLQTVGSCDREREAAQRINQFEPDFVVITGDYIAGPHWDTSDAIAAARQFLGELEPRLGTIVVRGHSESESERRRIFEGLDLLYLVNDVLRLPVDDGASVAFFGMNPHPSRSELALLETPREPGEVRVVVSHVPDLSRELNGLDVDLHLAGHTHGGQISIPGYGSPVTLSRLPRQYARGLHSFGDHLLNVSAGIGMEGNHAPRIRLFCPPELSFLVLAGRKSGEVDSMQE